MLRRIIRTCLLVTVPTMGCNKPPAETNVPEPAAEAPADDGALPAAEDVLTQSVEAMGGAAAFDAIKSSYTESKAEIKAQGITVVTYSWTKGDNFYSEADLAGMGKQQMWKKGDEIWSKDPVFGFRKLDGKEAAQARWSAEGPMLAANWNEYFDKAETTGRVDGDDGSLVEVELSSEDGQSVVMQFDEKTHLLIGMTLEQLSPMGATPMHTVMSDFREVAGIMVPFKTVAEVQMTTMETTTEKFEVNVEIPDSKFEPPKEGSDAPAAPAGDSAK